MVLIKQVCGIFTFWLSWNTWSRTFVLDELSFIMPDKQMWHISASLEEEKRSKVFQKKQQTKIMTVLYNVYKYVFKYNLGNWSFALLAPRKCIPEDEYILVIAYQKATFYKMYEIHAPWSGSTRKCIWIPLRFVISLVKASLARPLALYGPFYCHRRQWNVIPSVGLGVAKGVRSRTSAKLSYSADKL